MRTNMQPYAPLVVRPVRIARTVLGARATRRRRNHQQQNGGGEQPGDCRVPVDVCARCVCINIKWNIFEVR